MKSSRFSPRIEILEAITAKRSADGGNGFVKVTEIDATGVNLDNVSVAGDLVKITAASADPAKPAVKSLTAHSIGVTGAGVTAVPSDFFLRELIT
jgi:hypothetical protein